ncbi:MAG: hypothetical protein IJN90_05565 [Bacilli bacterium]|nr:hypothetical protein [Bacilli bacterium]
MAKLNIGESDTVRSLFRFVDAERKKDIDEYVLNGLSHNYQKFLSPEEILMTLKAPGYLTYDEASYIREYSGYNFKHLNQALRGKWNYEDNGDISRMDSFLNTATRIKKIIEKHATTGEDFIAYRGVNLHYFKDYGIKSIDELSQMEGKFLLDRGFVSTSLLESNCFFKKENDLGYDFNIKIEYLISKDFKDGIYIGDNPILTYSPKQYEYLINAHNIAKVARVKIGDDNTAVLTAVVVPKHIYDEYYMRQNKREK